jgi:hypothetical protein
MRATSLSLVRHSSEGQQAFSLDIGAVSAAVRRLRHRHDPFQEDDFSGRIRKWRYQPEVVDGKGAPQNLWWFKVPGIRDIDGASKWRRLPGACEKMDREGLRRSPHTNRLGSC